MADLTGFLQSPEVWSRIVEPGPRPPSVVGTALNMADRVMDQSQRGGLTFEQKRQVAEDTAKTALAHNVSEADSDWRTYNDAASGLNAQANQPGNNGWINFGVPIQQMQSEMDKIGLAAKQGSIPQAGWDLFARAAYQRTLNQYPTMGGVISQAAHESGLDTYIYQDQRLQQEQQKSSMAVDQAGNETAMKAFMESGEGVKFNTDGTISTLPYTQAQKLAIGQMYMQKKAQIALAEQTAQTAKTTAEATGMSSKETQAQQGAAALTWAEAQLSTKYQPFINALSASTQGMDFSDPNSQKMWNDIGTKMQSYRTAVSTNVRAGMTTMLAGLPPEQQKQAMDALDSYEKTQYEAASSLFTGDLSQAKLQRQTYEQFQAATGLNSLQSFPMWALARKTFGDAALQAAFPPGSTSQIPKQVTDALAQEAKGIKTYESFQAAQWMQDFGKVLRGDYNIQHLDPVKARQMVPGLISGMIQAADGYAKGTQDASMFTSTTSQYVSAITPAITPGASMKSVNDATRGMFQRNTTAALEKLQKEDPMMGPALMMGTRAFAAKVLYYDRNWREPATEDNNFGTLNWTHGRWEVRFDNVAYAKAQQEAAQRGPIAPAIGARGMSPFQSYNPTSLQSADYYKRRLGADQNSDLAKAAINANVVTQFLTQTDKYDKNVDMSLSDSERATRWRAGQSTLRQEGKPQQTSAQVLTNIGKALDDATVQVPQSDAGFRGEPQSAKPVGDGFVSPREVGEYIQQRFGLNADQAAGILGHINSEATSDDNGNWKVNSLNPHDGHGGSANGLFQFHGQNQANYKQWLGDKPDTWKNQVDFALGVAAGPQMLSAMKGARDSDEANRVWYGFERPAGYTPGNPEGVPSYPDRLRDSRKYAKMLREHN